MPRSAGRRLAALVLVLSAASALVVLAGVVTVAVVLARDRAAEEYPAQPEDSVGLYDPGYPVALPDGGEPQGDGELRGPHFALRVAQLAVTDAVPEHTAVEIGASEPFRAAEGHELVLAQLAFDPDDLVARWSDEARVRASIQVGDTATRLARLPEGHDVLAVSAPSGAQVLLTVTDAGRVQSLDLRTGERVDAEELYHPIRASPPLDHELYRGPGVVTHSGVEQEVDVVLRSDPMTPAASLERYLPESGWARPGRAWLLLNGVTGQAITRIPSDPAEPFLHVAFDLDPSATFTLVLPGGREVSARNVGHVSVHSVTAGEFDVVFDVPSSFRRGTVVIRPSGVLAGAVGPTTTLGLDGLRPHRDCGTPTTPCLDWSRPPAPVRIPVELS